MRFESLQNLYGVEVSLNSTGAEHGFDIFLCEPEQHFNLLISNRDRRGAESRVMGPSVERQKG
jgi:hypothetical protein